MKDRIIIRIFLFLVVSISDAQIISNNGPGIFERKHNNCMDRLMRIEPNDIQYFSTVSKDSILVNKCSLIIRESFAGILAGIPLAVCGGAIAVKLDRNNDSYWDTLDNRFYGVFGGYNIGVSFGVYIVNKTYNSNISYPGILISSIVGSLIGIEVSRDNIFDGVVGYAPLYLPIVFSIGYTELINRIKIGRKNEQIN